MDQEPEIRRADVPAIADTLGCTEKHVYVLFQRADLPAVKIGGRWYVHPERLHQRLHGEGAAGGE